MDNGTLILDPVWEWPPKLLVIMWYFSNVEDSFTCRPKYIYISAEDGIGANILMHWLSCQIEPECMLSSHRWFTRSTHQPASWNHQTLQWYDQADMGSLLSEKQLRDPGIFCTLCTHQWSVDHCPPPQWWGFYWLAKYIKQSDRSSLFPPPPLRPSLKIAHHIVW